MEHSFSIVIPAYNEVSSIGSTIKEINNLSGNFEIIVVDDGSTDGTAEIASLSGARVLRHQVNKGYGAALKTGIRNATHENIIITDADGTYPHASIPKLVQIFLTENVDMVVGARTNANAKIPLIRKPAKWLITKLASFLVKETIPDLNSGMRVMKKKVVEHYLRILPDGFSFTTTITLAMLTNNSPIHYEPIDYFKRTGRSKIKPIRDTLNFIQLIIRTILYFDPLRVFLYLSIPFIILGFSLILYQAVYFHNIGTIAIIITMTGIQLLAIGMLADLIVKRLF